MIRENSNRDEELKVAAEQYRDSVIGNYPDVFEAFIAGAKWMLMNDHDIGYKEAKENFEK